MHLFLSMPNIMTQRVKPFKGSPSHNYYGFASHGLGQMMRLGFSVYQEYAGGALPPIEQRAQPHTSAAQE